MTANDDRQCQDCETQMTNNPSWDLETTTLCTDPGCPVCLFVCSAGAKGTDPCPAEHCKNGGVCDLGLCTCTGTGFNGATCTTEDDTCMTGNTAKADCTACDTQNDKVCTACGNNKELGAGGNCVAPDCKTGTGTIPHCTTCGSNTAECTACASTHHLANDGTCVLDDCMTGANDGSNCTACNLLVCTECAEGYEVKADVCAKKADEEKDSSAAALVFSMFAAFAMLF